MKRAICLGGGGPAVGLHIGVLEGLQNKGIIFENADDVWALSCIGAWVGVIYNQANKGEGVEETKKFFRDVFRSDKSFKSFPMNTIFAPDWAGNAEAIMDFLVEPKHYKNAFVPREIMKSWLYTLSAMRRMSTTRRRRYRYGGGEVEEIEEFERFNEGDFNRWTLNHVLAVHPVVRFLTAMMYKSKVDGLSKLYYPNSSFLRAIKFDRLYDEHKPFIFHNAWNLSRQHLRLFANRRHFKHYGHIDAASLCACSALPFIEQTVEIDGDIYCEGALVDTVNFKDLLEDHPDLEEIWISRIVDADQIRPPRDLLDSMANLCEQFAATLGEDDIKLFRYHVQYGNNGKPIWNGTIVEIPVSSHINFKWSRSNLEHGIRDGIRAAEEAYDRYHDQAAKVKVPKAKRREPVIIKGPDREERMRARKQDPGFEHRLRELLAERADS